ncbi:hypothetical protein [Bradyrhizobium viridifuturi]|uniref:hypothetical protein n=1 Tax=Bradyrhizobium viridifuturi TaxID=1654716 RepID=UPI00067F486B|nr:hypothetical protein [Bradyrhizobium viridifuturi]
MHDNVIAFPAQAEGRAPATATKQTIGASIARLVSPDRKRRGEYIMRRVDEAAHLDALAGGVSSNIGLNEDLRERRKDAWRRAGAKVRFLRAKLDMNDAAGAAHQGLAFAADTPVLDVVDRLALVEDWRRAVLEQLLTPAPTAADLDWKRRRAAALNPYDWVSATPKQVEKALAEDETFLRSFPARHCRRRPK